MSSFFVDFGRSLEFPESLETGPNPERLELVQRMTQRGLSRSAVVDAGITETSNKEIRSL